MTRRLVGAAVLALCFCLTSLIPTAAFGQAVYGSILGTVTDPQGAAVAGAKVTVVNQTKGITEETTSNESGNYSVTHLVPDTYTVRVVGAGFKTTETKDIIVSADSGSHVDLKFQVGGASETVEVTAEAPQLKTDREDVAVQFNSRYVEDLPILNRNFTTFELLSPGTQKLVGWSHAATENPQGGQQIFVNGQHFSGTGFELDGTDNQDPILGIIVINPNLDGVTEAKVALGNYDAEFGKAVAGLVTAQTKSGNNEYHGSGFYFRRSDANQARDPFTQYAPDPITHRFIPASKWQQFGGSLGGAIIKDKLFFFGDYQGTKQTSGVSSTLTIPTAEALSTCNPATNATSDSPGYCNLSAYVPFIGNGKPVTDPTSTAFLYDPTTGDQNLGTGRAPFCGPLGCIVQPNYIPIARIPIQVQNILALFPSPSNSQVTNNFIGSGSGPFKQNAFDTRIDYNASQSLSVFGRFSLSYFNLSGVGLLGKLGGTGNGLGGLNGIAVTHNYSLASGFTKTISSSLLTDFRFGYFRYNPQTHKSDEGTTPANGFGIPNLNLGNTATSGLPSFFLDGTLSPFGDGLNVGRCNCPLTEREQQFQFVNNWTKIHGNHQFKVGGDFRRATNLRVPSDANRTGELNFSKKITSDGGNGGLDLASFLLGDVSLLNRYVSTVLNATEHQYRFFVYGQDTWRATTKLTVNYGLRWELYTPEAVNAKGNGGFANLTEGVIRVGGYGPYGLNGNISNKLNAFAPRLGFAYQWDSKTVIRAGYGRSYDLGVFGSNFGHTVTQNLPVLIKQRVNAVTQFGPAASNDIIPAFTLSAGPPLAVFPTIPSNGQLPLLGPDGRANTNIRPLKQVLPTLDAWNLTVQRQVTNTLSLEVAYVGNKGSHGFAGNGPAYNINPVRAATGSNIVGCSVALVLGACPTGNLQYNGYSAGDQASRRFYNNKFTYPGFTDPITGATLQCCANDISILGNDASSAYNAFQVKVDKRFSHGLQFLAHYTFAKAYNYTDNYYAISHPIAYGPDDFVRTHVFVTNIVYELPIGKGKAFGANYGRAFDLIFGGIQLNNTTNWSSGLPFTASIGECGQVVDAGPCRPNTAKGSGFSTGGSHFDPINHIVQYFTPVAALSYPDPNTLALGTDACSLTRPTSGPFALPACGTIGNIGRNTFHGPRQFTSDLSLLKNFAVTEKVKAQFRMDAFNVFNHPVLGFSSTQGNTCVDCSGNAGQITGLQADTPQRQLQFAVRVTF